jgi:hypothetical protein
MTGARQQALAPESHNDASAMLYQHLWANAGCRDSSNYTPKGAPRSIVIRRAVRGPTDAQLLAAPEGVSVGDEVIRTTPSAFSLSVAGLSSEPMLESHVRRLLSGSRPRCADDREGAGRLWAAIEECLLSTIGEAPLSI